MGANEVATIVPLKRKDGNRLVAGITRNTETSGVVQVVPTLLKVIVNGFNVVPFSVVASVWATDGVVPRLA